MTIIYQSLRLRSQLFLRWSLISIFFLRVESNNDDELNARFSNFDSDFVSWVSTQKLNSIVMQRYFEQRYSIFNVLMRLKMSTYVVCYIICWIANEFDEFWMWWDFIKSITVFLLNICWYEILRSNSIIKRVVTIFSIILFDDIEWCWNFWYVDWRFFAFCDIWLRVSWRDYLVRFTKLISNWCKKSWIVSKTFSWMRTSYYCFTHWHAMKKKNDDEDFENSWMRIKLNFRWCFSWCSRNDVWLLIAAQRSQILYDLRFLIVTRTKRIV